MPTVSAPDPPVACRLDDQVGSAMREKLSCLRHVVTGVAHEINSPLGAVASIYDSLRRAVDQLDALTPEPAEEGSRRRAAQLRGVIDGADRVIREGLERVHRTVRNLETFVSLDRAERQQVDVAAGLASAVALLQFSFHQRHTRLELDLRPTPRVWGWPALLNQAFAHLILNAVQALRDGGTIRVGTGVDGGDAVVTIADTGPGIDPQILSQRFRPGYTTKAAAGTGLGLAMVKQTIDRHGGSIDVDSRPGAGTTFTIRLPANPA